jgi:hypothetical protein
MVLSHDSGLVQIPAVEDLNLYDPTLFWGSFEFITGINRSVIFCLPPEQQVELISALRNEWRWQDFTLDYLATLQTIKAERHQIDSERVRLELGKKYPSLWRTVLPPPAYAEFLVLSFTTYSTLGGVTNLPASWPLASGVSYLALAGSTILAIFNTVRGALTYFCDGRRFPLSQETARTVRRFSKPL